MNKIKISLEQNIINKEKLKNKIDKKIIEQDKKINISYAKLSFGLMIIVLFICGSYFISNSNILKNNPSNKIINNIVLFETMGGSFIESLEIEKNKKITKPEDPVKIGFIFEGWEVNGKLFDFNTQITGNVILTARWKDDGITEKIIVRFNSDGGSIVNDIKIAKYTVLNPPLNPTRSNYVFKGWYLNNNLFDFNQLITENIKLDAKWEKATSSNIIDNSNINNINPSNNINNQRKMADISIRHITYNENKSVKIEFSGMADAFDKIEIYRSTTEYGSYTKIGITNYIAVDMYIFNSSSLDIDSKYYYKARLINDTTGKTYYGEYSKVVEVPAYLTAPKNLFIDFTYNNDKVSFDSVPNATYYYFYSDAVVGGGWIDEYRGVKTSFEMQTLSKSKPRKYRVKAISETTFYSIIGPYSDIVNVPILTRPNIEITNAFYNSSTSLITFDIINPFDVYTEYRIYFYNSYMGYIDIKTLNKGDKFQFYPNVLGSLTADYLIQGMIKGNGFSFYGNTNLIGKFTTYCALDSCIN